MQKNKQGNVEKGIKTSFPHGFETQTVIITDSPYHVEQKGEKVLMGKSVAERMLKNKWAKALMFALFMLALVGEGEAQEGVDIRFRNTTYKAVTSPAILYTDTVTNAGTGSVVSARVGGPGTTTTIELTATEISGTGAGTATLYGSLDGTNFYTLVLPGTATAVNTQTITDTAGSKRYVWILQGSPALYYRIDHTGSGTMVYTIAARLMKH